MGSASNLQLMELSTHLSYVPNFSQQQQWTADYNPSSATEKSSFHGTGISLIQHPSHEFKGHDRNLLVINKTPSSLTLSRSTATLPLKYTNVPPASLKSKEFTAPMVDGSVRSTVFQVFTAAKMGELNWLETVMTALKQEQLDEMDWISWSAYHASIQETVIPPAAISVLLPLFLESAHSVPVLATDQPLFVTGFGKTHQLHTKIII